MFQQDSQTLSFSSVFGEDECDLGGYTDDDIDGNLFVFIQLITQYIFNV